MSIEIYIQQSIAGNRTAQKELYSMYAKAMFNVVLRIVKQSENAEDVMHDAFIKAFQKLDQFKGDVTFGAWLKKIMIHQAIDHLRQQNKYITSYLDDINELEHVADDYLDYDGLNKSEIINCINRLKDNYRIIITLKLIEGYDYEEIGTIMNLTYAQSRTMFSRAKEKLKSELQILMLKHENGQN